jgi:TniB protein
MGIAAVPTTQKEQRIQAIQKRTWIGYTRALMIREQLENLLNYPRTHRMPNLAIIGETNNGKSMLLKSFLRRHGPPDDPNVDHTTLPVLLLDTPSEPDEARLYRKMLERLFATASNREPADSMFSRLKVILRHLETRMIILDEFNNAVAGAPVKQRRFLNAVRLMGNELEIPIVAAGTPEALAAIQSDAQLANRFEPIFLPKWQLDAEYGRFLKSVEKEFGLAKPSNLIDPKFAQKLLEVSGGTIGEFMEILRRLAIKAIRTGEEQITIDMLKLDYLSSLGWVEPSKRTTYPTS